MTTILSDSLLDLPCDGAALSDTVYYLSSQPTSVADLTTYLLGSKAVTPGDGNGNFTKANGDTSGRKLTVEPVADVPISSNGTINHVAISNGTHFAATTCPDTAVTSGTSRNMAAWDIEFADAAPE